HEATAVIGAFGTRRARLPLEKRADEVGETLEDIDTHRALAEETEARELVEGALQLRIGDDRGPAGGQHRNEVAIARLVERVVLQRPQQRYEFGRGRLQERRHEDVIGAETDAVLADRGARLLVQRLHV